MTDETFGVVDGFRGQFFIVQNAIIEAHGASIGVNGIAVYCALVMHGSRSRQAWPSQQRIATLTGLSRSTVHRTLQDLEARGLVVSEVRSRPDGGNSTKLYRIPPVSQIHSPCVTDTQQNNTNINYRDTTYPSSPTQDTNKHCVSVASTATDTTANTREPDTKNTAEYHTPWYAPHVAAVHETYECHAAAGLRTRALKTMFAALAARSPNGKSVPPAIAAALNLVYTECFGNRYPADIGRLRKLANRRGGDEMLVRLMVEAAAVEILGDPHSFLETFRRNNQRQPEVDTWAWGRDAEG